MVAVRPNSKVEPSARAATELAGATPSWLLADPERLSGSIVRDPIREDFTEPIDDRLVVEHYSR